MFAPFVAVASALVCLTAACTSGSHGSALRGAVTPSVQRCVHPVPERDIVVQPPNVALNGALALVDTRTGRSRVLRATIGAEYAQAIGISHARCAVSFATDASFPGERLAGGVHTVDAWGGDRRRVSAAPGDEAEAMAWSPDDSRMAISAVSGSTSSLWVVPAAGRGEPTRVAVFTHVTRDGQPVRLGWLNRTTVLALVTRLARPYVFSTSIWAFHLDGSRELIADANRLGVERIDESTLDVDPHGRRLLIGCYRKETGALGSRPALCSVDLATLRAAPIRNTTAAVEGIWLADGTGVAYLRAVRRDPRNFPIMIERHGVVSELRVRAFARGVYDIA